MTNINWLDYSILILAVFSVNYLVVNEGAIIISKKPYLTKWGLCFIVSMLLILLHRVFPLLIHILSSSFNNRGR